MKRTAFALLLGAALGVAAAAPATAQSGFALKGHYIINASDAQQAREDRVFPEDDGLGLGLEFVLPFGLGVGVSGYTADEAGELDTKTTELTLLAEANYFVKIPLFPVSPYVGLHGGLGLLSGDVLDDPQLELQDKTRSTVGFQVGVRFQPTSLIGLDAQWRRMSTSAAEGQDDSLERNQVLIGVTLF